MIKSVSFVTLILVECSTYWFKSHFDSIQMHILEKYEIRYKHINFAVILFNYW